MLFIETPIFTKLVTDLMPDDEYRKIQLALVLRPEAGKKLYPAAAGFEKFDGKAVAVVNGEASGLSISGMSRRTEFTCF
jgi:hypothetical protein